MLYPPAFKICKEKSWASAQVDLAPATNNVANVRELWWLGKAESCWCIQKCQKTCLQRCRRAKALSWRARIYGRRELNITSNKTNAAGSEIQAWVFRRAWNEEHYDPLRGGIHPADFE